MLASFEIFFYMWRNGKLWSFFLWFFLFLKIKFKNPFCLWYVRDITAWKLDSELKATTIAFWALILWPNQKYLLGRYDFNHPLLHFLYHILENRLWVFFPFALSISLSFAPSPSFFLVLCYNGLLLSWSLVIERNFLEDGFNYLKPVECVTTPCYWWTYLHTDFR